MFQSYLLCHNFKGTRCLGVTTHGSAILRRTGSSHIGGGYLYLNSIVLLSRSRIILLIISQLEERYKFGKDEAGESISAKIDLLEVEVIKIPVLVRGGERKDHGREVWI